MSTQLGLFEPAPFDFDFGEDPEGSDPDGLRYYQRDAVDAAARILRNVRACMLVMATGCGKTQIGSALAKQWDGNILWLAHRDELVQQAVDRLRGITGEDVEIEQADLKASHRARIVVASVDTIKQQHRLDRMGRDRFQLVIPDECFPAGTLVDGIPIENLCVGDLVWSIDHETGRIEKRPVTSVFRSSRSELLVLRSGATEVRCTNNHPFFVKGRGYVEAKNIVPGDLLCVWRPVRGFNADLWQAKEDVFLPVSLRELLGSYGAYQSPLRLGAYEDKKPNAHGSQSAKGEPGSQGEGPWASGAWRKRERPDGVRDDSIVSPGLWLGWESRGPYKDAAVIWLPKPLQDRPGATGPDGRFGSGRGEPQQSDSPSTGPEEIRVLVWQRVDSIESDEPTGSGGVGVYNIEVAGAHTYFANGILVHNCHHFNARTYQRPLDYFADAKVCGLTATPDRGDKKALGRIFDEVAYVMDILDAIDAGYLVPIRGHRVHLEGLDLSAIRAPKGDLAIGELDDVMARVINGIVEKTLELGGERQGIGFFPGVRSAELAMLRFNEMSPGSAAFVSGTTETNERRRIVADFKHGRIRYLCNCQVATEGFDAPSASLIIQGRPTLSRSLYAQMSGRGTRVLPGTVEHIAGREEASDRRGAIERSAKPDCLILDFVGNSGKHCLIGPADALGGSFSEDAVKKAKESIRKNPGMSVGEALKQARAELERLARQDYQGISAKIRPFDPFYVLELDTPDEVRYAQYGKVAPATPGQLNALANHKVDARDLKGLSKRAAERLLTQLKERRKQGLATYNQMRWLKLHGVDSPQVSYKNAGKALDYLFGQKRSSGYIDPGKLSGLAFGKKS